MSLLLNNRYKNTYIWILVSLLLLLFSTIYEIFSFGVISFSMIFPFLYPLLLGALPTFIIEKNGLSKMNRIYIDGVIILTIRSLIVGVLEIYGTDTHFSKYYMIIGLGLILLGIITYYLNTKLKKTVP